VKIKGRYLAEKEWEDGLMKKSVIEGAFNVPTTAGERPSLKGSKCSDCDYLAFPPARVCPICLKENTMEEVSLGPKGKLDSFAVVRQAPPGFIAPYMLGIVRLPEGPEVFTLITGCEVSDTALTIGQEMELIIDRIRDDDEGNEIIGWKFRPANS
jgi:uncharacterized OB-fold protein